MNLFGLFGSCRLLRHGGTYVANDLANQLPRFAMVTLWDVEGLALRGSSKLAGFSNIGHVGDSAIVSQDVARGLCFPNPVNFVWRWATEFHPSLPGT